MTKQDIINYVTETPKNTNKAVLNTMLNQISSGSSDDGESNNMAKLSKLTITLNIDDTSHIDAYGVTGLVAIHNGILSEPILNAPQATQIWEGYVVPSVGTSILSYILYAPYIILNDESYKGYYNFTFSNMINCTEDLDNPGNGSFYITDPTKPASCTANAVYTLYN